VTVARLREQIGIAAYFISWAFLAGFIMMNIVLAILVDSFTEAQAALKHEQVPPTPLSPLLHALSRLSRTGVQNWRQLAIGKHRQLIPSLCYHTNIMIHHRD
jgi:hypothetical protein